MTITTTKLTRAAGLCAVAGGLLFIAVQINHPVLDATFTTTTEYAVRESSKIVMAVLSLIGITGIYLRQVRQTGVLGLIGYVVFGLGYLAIMTDVVIGVVVLPTLAVSEPGYVNDVLALATSGTPVGNVGPIGILIQGGGFAYIVGGAIFGVALFRAGVLARWAAALLTLGAAATIATSQLPELVQRLFAFPVSVSLIGLGYSLWREQRTHPTPPMASAVSSQLDPTGAK
jgi:hypothetical protein